MKAALRFNNYCVEYMSYRRNHVFWESLKQGFEPVDMTPAFMFDVVLNPKSILQANVIIGVKIGNEDNEEMAPFNVEVVIRGFFEIVNDSIEKEQVFNFYSHNAVAILYPYVRSIITDLTGRSDHQPIILPTLNVAKIVSEYLKDNKTAKESKYDYINL